MRTILIVLVSCGPLLMLSLVLAMALARAAARPLPPPIGPVGEPEDHEDAPAYLPGAAPDSPLRRDPPSRRLPSPTALGEPPAAGARLGGDGHG